MGLFQKCDGKFNISVTGVDIVSIEKRSLHPLQKRYQMSSGFDEDFVICPTLQSIMTGNIPLVFRINHSQFRPTHKLTWVPHQYDYPHSHYVLEGIDYITSLTENGGDIRLQLRFCCV